MILQPLAENVWLFPHDPDEEKVQPSVGVVCDGRQTILIDGGNGDHHAWAIQAALKEINAPPVQLIIYTHHHWDHVFGAHCFEVPTLAQRLCHQLLNQEATLAWGQPVPATSCYTLSQPALIQATADWSAFRIIVPAQTFGDHLTLPLEGMTMALWHVGGRHALDSIVIRVNGVLFMGDCFYPGRGSTQTDWAMVRQLLSDTAHEILVSSHAQPASRAAWLAYMETLPPE